MMTLAVPVLIAEEGKMQDKGGRAQASFVDED